MNTLLIKNTMDYSEPKTPKRSLFKGHQILALFQTQLSLDNALSALLLHGYSRAEIEVRTQSEVDEECYMVAGALDDSDAVSVEKSIAGIKYGALAGSVMLGLAIAYLIQFQPQMLQAGPLATCLFGLAVGAVWGGTLGFIIWPQLPFSRPESHEVVLSRDQIFLSFQPKSLEDERFFKSLKWPMYTLAN